MTENTNKLRAVFLTALMIGSVFAAGIAFTGTAAADHQTADREFSPSELNNSLVFAGQVIAVDASSSSDTEIQLRRSTGSGTSTPIANNEKNTSTGDGYVLFDTSDLETGDYFLSADNFTRSNSGFEIVEQTVEAEFDASSAGNAGQTATLGLDVSSPLRNNYNGSIHVDGFSDEDYNDVFGQTASEDDDGNSMVELDEIDNGTIPLDFDGIEAGDYSFEISVDDTDATVTANITVSDVGAGQATFPSEGFSQTRGDFAAITVDLANTDQGTVHVGSQGVNYLANMTVTDGNDDGQVTILMNTYTAGNLSAAGETSVYTAAGDNDDSVSNVNLLTENLTSPLSTGDYEVNASVGDAETGVTTLFLEERSTTGASTGVAPGEAATTDYSEISSAATERDNVANSDKAVLQFDVSGIYGYVTEDYNFSEGPNSEADGVFLNIVQTPGSTAPNANPATLNASNVSYVTDSANDTFYAIVDTDEFDVSDGQVYEAELSINGSNPYVLNDDATETVSTTFEVEEVDASFNGLNDDDVLAVPPQSEVSVSGQTNLAPGTELNIRARSTMQGNSFIKNPSATVQDDGSISAEFDFSEYEEDTEFSWSIRSGSTPLSTVDGLVTSDAAGTTDPGTTDETTTEQTNTTADGTDTTADGTDTTADGTDTTEDDDDGGSGSGIPGFGVGIALVALLGAALLALRE